MILPTLADWLAAGGNRIGQIAIGGQYELCHVDDLGKAGLENFTDAEAARHLSLVDEAGNYRPLKTAPNLRHGWKLTVGTLEELRRALDHFYPAMLGSYVAWKAQRLPATCLRATVNRQSGMYAITRQITTEQADALVGDFCQDEKCLKTIRWTLEPGVPVSTLPPEKFTPVSDGAALPLWCAESCNLLVAAARGVVKQSPISS
ncbi:MAG: DR2241 family protein [Chthoniobacteraceae bacterium]